MAADVTANHQDKKVAPQTLPVHSTNEGALQFILDWINAQNQNWQVNAVGHRIVHGGSRFTTSVPTT